MLEAVMVDDPTDTAVNKPVELTVPAAVLVQVNTGWGTKALPNWSRADAANCWVPPTLTDVGFGLTTMEVWTGAALATEIASDPLIAPLVAVTVVVPTPPDVKRPLELTVPTAVFELVQVNVGWGTIGFRFWSYAIAVNWTAEPRGIGYTFGTLDVTLTMEKTGSAGELTETKSVPEIPPTKAVMVDEPTEPAVKRPELLIVPTAVFELTQVNAGWGTKALPNWSTADAVNCWVAPGINVTGPGLTTIVVATGAALTTLIVVVPLTPPLDTVIVVVPIDDAVKSPEALTVPTPVFELE
jgi:hypothetical protein